MRNHVLAEAQVQLVLRLFLLYDELQAQITAGLRELFCYLRRFWNHLLGDLTPRNVRLLQQR